MPTNLAEIGIIIILINLGSLFLCPNGRRNVFPWAIGLILFLSPQHKIFFLRLNKFKECNVSSQATAWFKK